MTSLAQRIDALITASPDYVASLAIKEGSVAILEEYIQKIQDGLRALDDVVATISVAMSGYRHQEYQYQARLEELDQAIDLFLQRDHMKLALDASGRYNTATSLLELFRERAAREQAEYQKCVQARTQLEARLAEIRQDRDQVRLLLEGSSEGEEVIAPGTPEQLAQAMQQRLDQATDQGRISIDQLDQELEQALETRLIQEQISARRQRLNL